MINLVDIKPFRDEDNDSINFERRFLIPISLAGAVFSFASILTNGIINLDEVVQLTPYITFFVYLGIFLWAWNKKNVVFAKYFIILFTLTLINFLWYYNYGANGPILYLFILIYSYLIFMVKGKQLVFFTILIALNISVLFYIEYNHPGLVKDYTTHHQQIVDVYLSMLFYGLIVFIMMYIAKISYIHAYNEAKKADKLKTAFLENMSHEVRTPLNAIVGFSNLLAEDDISHEDRKEYIELINESNRSLLQLVNDILDVSLIEANQISLNNEDINISETINNLKITYKLLIQKKTSSIDIAIEIPNEEIHIIGDKTRLRQVLTNLLDNAVKFTESGLITIGVKERDNDILFFVKDTGIGIERQYHRHLFDRFYKVEDKKDVLFRGTGIGLYLSKKIIDLMGGKIWVISEPGKGSDFQFIIPKKGFRKVTLKINEHENNIKKLKRHLKILVAEDHRANQIYYAKVFKGLNIEVLIAENGIKAIKMFKENPDIDLVLMDIKMPEMDGFKAFEEIRKINHQVPIIAQTAFAMDKDREKCLGAGFNGFVAKPVTKEMLLKVLHETGII